MDKDIFVQNIKNYCHLKGVKPTIACRESGVGSSFINNIEAKGSIPSVEKVQLLADYLGVTTSELLGEPVRPAPDTPIGFDDFTYAMQSEAGDLTDADKALLLSMARQLNEARKKRNGETD